MEVTLFLGQDIWELGSGGVEKFFLCGGLDGLRNHWEMPPMGPKPQRCLEMLRSGEKKQFKSCVELHFTILASNVCACSPAAELVSFVERQVKNHHRAGSRQTDMSSR